MTEAVDETARHQRLLRELLLEKYEPIAIVGVGLRFPGRNDGPADFANFLHEGRSGTGPVPADRWDVAGHYSEVPVRGKTSASGGGFLEQIDRFDPRFFNISPKEAQYIDPQHRLAMETAWEALEDANIDPASLKGRNGGVYFGISCFDYTLEIGAMPLDELDAYVGTGTAHSALPGRLSYLLGWRGPSMAVDSACSSSIVALDLAVAGLRRGDCDIAISGGVNAIHHPLNHVVFTQAGMLSPDGECKTFDDAADGYARSEGCGVVLLKRLSDARRDGDRILALIRGTAVRQDGESGGLTVPNGAAQEAVMRAALAAAALGPADVSYVEAHGTGTSLGDPIEMGSIRAVFADRSKDDPILVGSLKTNVGHMEAAAGIGGVIKAALQAYHGVVYPHLNVDKPSGHIPWDSYPVEVPATARVWDAPVRRALVNSFGFAGTIASAVIEQPPPSAVPVESPAVDAGPQVFALSAKSDRALTLQVERYRAYLDAKPGVSVRDLCYTAGVGRSHFDCRLAGVVRDEAELRALLERGPGTPGTEIQKVALLFTGQGAQYPGMGRDLYERYPVFRTHFDACDRLFAGPLGMSIKEVIRGEGATAGLLDQTQYTQPALFAVEYATAMLWLSWGIVPSVVIGHSIGEVAAATVAGLFSLEDAVHLVAARARLMQSVTAPGGMIAVQAPAADVAPLIEGHADVAFAAMNAPGQCVVSGGSASLAEIAGRLTERGLAHRALAVSHAFHSPLMDEVYDEFRAAIAGIRFGEPELTLISTVTGAPASAEVATVDYWVRHIGEPVNFEAAMRTAGGRGRHVYIEVGPAPHLTALGRRCLSGGEDLWLASMRPNDEAGDAAEQALARAYSAGVAVSWTGYHQGREGRRVPLPTYAFDTKRYWLPAREGRRGPSGAVSAAHPLVGAEVTTPEQAAAGVRGFRAPAGVHQLPWLGDHVVMGQVVFPAAGYVEMLVALQDELFGDTRRPLEDVAIQQPLIFADEDDIDLWTRVEPRADGGCAVTVTTRVPSGETTIERLHLTAAIGAGCDLDAGVATAAGSLRERAAGAATAPVPYDVDDLYAHFAERGLEYGPEFCRITELARVGDVAVGRIRGHVASRHEYAPPPLLDNVMQTVAAVLTDGPTFLPVGYDRLQVLKRPKGPSLDSLLRVTAGDESTDELVVDLMLSEGDRPVMIVNGLRYRRVNTVSGRPRRRLFHETRWVKRSLRRGGDRLRDVLAVHAGADTQAALSGTGPVEVRFAGDAAAADALLDGWQPTDVCWFWRASGDAPSLDSIRAECAENYRDLLALVSVLERRGFGKEQRLWLVTEGAALLPGDDPDEAREAALPAATLSGFGLSLWNEYPAFRAGMVDLDPAAGPGALLDEVLGAEAEEFVIAYRHGQRHVRRVFPVETAADTAGNAELTPGSGGELGELAMRPVDDVTPTGDEVTVAIAAAGLNFKDVLNALGMLARHAQETGAEHRELPLGFEGSGTVVAAGPQARFQVGDEVIVSHLGCMRRRVTVPSAMVVRKPTSLTFAEAGGLPTAFTTAYHALHTLAGIRPGDRVLVHAGAGGVGQAAIQLARHAGAEVFATASPGKQDFLRAQGVRHVMNSRTLDFADEIMEITGGSGVDIVLNSLNKDFIPAGLRVLAEGGRFVELGKIGIWSAEQVYADRPDVAYHNFDLSELPEQQAQQLNREIMEAVTGLLDSGAISALPTTVYTLDEVEEAFGVLSRGANIGKLVLDLRPRPALGAAPAAVLSPDETYLITGGLGALGEVTARKLVKAGARRLCLVSRREVAEAERAAFAARLGGGAEVEFVRADIADPADVARVFDTVCAGGRRLGGVLHAAGVLADAPVSALTWEHFDKVFGAKVYGSWLLHQAVRRTEGVRFFVGYSSVAAGLGSLGQANYAAGNAFIDALMAGRAARGEAGQAVGWGPWAEVGMAANLSGQQIRGIEGQGLKFLKPAEGARALMNLLGQPVHHVMVGEFDWERYVAGRPLPNAAFAAVARTTGAARTTVDLDALRQLPRVERRSVINTAIRARIAGLLHFDGAEDIPLNAKFLELGLDSLTAVELKNTLESMFALALPSSIVFDHPSVAALAEYVDGLLVPVADDTATPADQLAVVRELSDDDADAELAALRGV